MRWRGGARERAQFSPSGGNGDKRTLRRRSERRGAVCRLSHPRLCDDCQGRLIGGPPLQLPPQRPPNQGNPKPKAVGKGDLVCSIQQGKEGRGELLSAQFGQRPGHLLLIDRVGVKVQVGVVNFVVIEFLKFWNHIDTTNQNAYRYIIMPIDIFVKEVLPCSARKFLRFV